MELARRELLPSESRKNYKVEMLKYWLWYFCQRTTHFTGTRSPGDVTWLLEQGAIGGVPLLEFSSVVPLMQKHFCPLPSSSPFPGWWF